MSKFKVGNKVVRTNGDFGFVREGDVCLITEIRGDGQLEIDGDDGRCHTPSNYALYVEGILTPLEVVEAILNRDVLEVITSNKGDWKTLLKHPNSLTVKQLKYWKFRHKPKTIVINGAEVPAPIGTKYLGYPDKVYGVNFSRKSVYDTTGNTDKGLFWATKKDAQKVLGAMLIPFNES